MGGVEGLHALLSEGVVAGALRHSARRLHMQMGNCSRTAQQKKVLPTCLPEAAGSNHSELSYPTIATLTISQTSSNRRSPYVEFPLPAPSEAECKSVRLPTIKFWASECTLPGVDPVDVTPKPCQDVTFCTSDNTSLFFGVIDGHGPDGRDIAAYCKKKAISTYTAAKATYPQAPQKFLEDLIRTLDADTKSQSTEFDSGGSGW